MSEEDIDELFKIVEANEGMEFTIDLVNEIVVVGDKQYSFKIDAFKRHCLLNGLDNIGLTLQHEDAISSFENNIPSFLD